MRHSNRHCGDRQQQCQQRREHQELLRTINRFRQRPAFLFQGDPALVNPQRIFILLFKHRHRIRRTGKHIAVGQAAARLYGTGGFHIL